MAVVLMSEFIITRIEGLKDRTTRAEFLVFVDTCLLSRIPLFQPEKKICLPVQGKLKVVCKDINSNFKHGSFSVDVKLLREACWLPLVASADDSVSKIPCICHSEIWIQLTPTLKVLGTVLEVTENTESELCTQNSNSSFEIPGNDTENTDNVQKDGILTDTIKKLNAELLDAYKCINGLKEEIKLKEAENLAYRKKLEKAKAKAGRNEGENRSFAHTRILTPKREALRSDMLTPFRERKKRRKNFN